MLTVEEAASYLSVSVDTIYRLCAERALPHLRIRKPRRKGEGLSRGLIRFNPKKLDEFIEVCSMEVEDWEERAAEIVGRKRGRK